MNKNIYVVTVTKDYGYPETTTKYVGTSNKRVMKVISKYDLDFFTIRVDTWVNGKRISSRIY